jgi:hypothetical protein
VTGMLGVEVRIHGLDEVIRATERIDGAPPEELENAAQRSAEKLAELVRAAGQGSDRQSARAAATVRVEDHDGYPSVTAGPHPLLFGSEFGALGRFGWYSKPRYRNSQLRQFRTHLGSGSYWFFRTIEENAGAVESELDRALELVTRRWRA